MRRSKDPNWSPSYAPPSESAWALGTGADLGLSANLRYNLIAGLERWMSASWSGMAAASAGTAVARVINHALAEPIQHTLTGLPRRNVDWRATRARLDEATRNRMLALAAAKAEAEAAAAAVAEEEEEEEEATEGFVLRGST